jgi:hypothetical protein
VNNAKTRASCLFRPETYHYNTLVGQ